ncbi:hypothetical protein PO883_09635 [Massilia sp. DJPM01]|uniref:hypothetical protein n=1 Tax=Massilia sp. DJPM01 TaxID=3024404 RepID=UPI00259D8DCB|nr:hypothetical protein [Massilia sp. DJPM01]MDM5177451.1 hypothetical protein [Massilia sp. DJPM01]
MRKILLFVHGTGVRKVGYDAAFELACKQAAKYELGVTVEGCSWGESVGAKLSKDGASIPTYGTTRSAGPSPEDEQLALWDLSLQDPTFELGMLSASARRTPDDRPPNAEEPGTALLKRFSQLPDANGLVQRLKELGLYEIAPPDEAVRPILPEAVDAVQASPAYKAARKSGAAGTPEHRHALARAAIASILQAALNAGLPVPGGEVRDELEEDIRRLLDNDTYGVLDFILSPLAGLAANAATWHVKRKRKSIMDAAFPVAGDILLYQARGAVVRTFIRAELEKFENDDVTIMAHSLGGIAAVETLIETPAPNVRQLVTFGSQAAFFHEIGALATLKPGADLPAGFPAWLNFYDLNDPLSYIANGIFKAARDCRVESKASFPASHSAYLHSEVMWKEVAKLYGHV